jgi:hypothetical protein
MPHQLRPVKITDRKTSGNHKPQKAKLTVKVKLLSGVAPSGGSGKKRGTKIATINPTKNVACI